MQIAILSFSIIGAVTGTASLLIIAKTAKELKAAKIKVETELEAFKTEAARKKQIAKRAIAEMEL